MRFVERREFNADPAEVWKRVSNLETIPTYWHGTKEFVATKSEGRTTADVVFAFGGKGKVEVTVDEEGRSFVLDYLQGPFRGRQKTTVRDNVLESEWDVTFSGAYKVLGPWNASHLRSGTRHALERLCEGRTV